MLIDSSFTCSTLLKQNCNKKTLYHATQEIEKCVNNCNPVEEKIYFIIIMTHWNIIFKYITQRSNYSASNEKGSVPSQLPIKMLFLTKKKSHGRLLLCKYLKENIFMACEKETRGKQLRQWLKRLPGTYPRQLKSPYEMKPSFWSCQSLPPWYIIVQVWRIPWQKNFYEEQLRR